MDNYVVFARKYRPTTFESVVGQQVLTQTLKNAIKTNHLAHAYLFCGPRGVGKTTCARIFAKTINCLHPSDDFEACNECESCVAFNEQRSFNIHELDAASNNSVDDIRSLIDQVRIPPQIGKYSVYIIDEVHMLSQGAFNALLKTLEEPPSYAIFILATTEKHKVLPTILSRCQVYDFSRITISDIVHHLQNVAEKEGIEVAEEALNVVAQKADGGMRDALSIFDQLVAFCGKKIEYEKTIEVLNVLDTDYYFQLVDCALTQNFHRALSVFDEVLSKGFDAQNFMSGLATHLRNLLVSKDPQTISLIETSDNIRQQYLRQAQQCSARFLISTLNEVNKADIDYRTSKNKRLVVELMLINLCMLLAPQVAATAPATTAETPAKASPQKPVTPVAAPSNAAPTSMGAAPQTPAAPKPLLKAPPSLSMADALQSEKKNNLSAAPQPAPAVTTAPAAIQSQPINSSVISISQETVEEVWHKVVNKMADNGRLKAILTTVKPKLQGADKILLTLDNIMQEEEIKQARKRLQELLAELLGQRLSITTTIAEVEHTQKAYTSMDKYRLLAEKNPVLQDLTNRLQLQLD